ncbi:MAG TPA: tRNA (adenosine(37)-N6)-threonylcarbamoyltransferase complex dimerization subunit type 1 TsaB [Bryobacteraceae bacterium]
MNPLILAVDTTHEWGSLALTRGTDLLEQIEIQAQDGFAHVLYGPLAALLERHGLKPQDIDCFASAAGPGSFTGVRVGLACIKGLAEACGRPAVGVSNLEALASFGSAPLRAAVMDARRDEIYGAVYDSGGAAVTAEVVARFDRWIEILPEGQLQFVCFSLPDLRERLRGTRFESAPVLTAPRAIAAAIARIAFHRFVCGLAQDPAALDANYVRRSDAELFWKD